MRSIAEFISRCLTSCSKSRPKKANLPHQESLIASKKVSLNTPTTRQCSADKLNDLENYSPLFNLDLLSIKLEDHQWFTSVNIAVRDSTKHSQTQHTYEHIRRIISNAAHILDKEEKHHQWARQINPVVVWVSCMTYGVGDILYKAESETRSKLDIIDDFLKHLGCPLPTRRQVAYLTAQIHVGVALCDEDRIDAFATGYPAFRVIQDAFRLAELGAIGITRFVMFRGFCECQSGNLHVSAGNVVRGAWEQYVHTMETEAGRKMAEERYRWMEKVFWGQWEQENDTSNV
jgi:hypothetical protein